MNSPLKRNSDLLKNLRKEEPLERKRARTSMLLAAIIIKALRVRKWNKLEFAKQVNKKPSVITKWLSGTHNFTSDTLSDIEHILGIQLFNCDQGDNEITFKAAISAGMTINIFPTDATYTDTMNTSVFSFDSSSSIQVIQKNCPELN